MAATDMEFEQNAGTPDQLPQGAASDLNAALPETGEPHPPEGFDISPFAEEEDAGTPLTPFKPGKDPEDEMLFLDAEGASGPNIQFSGRSLPPTVLRQLLVMKAAANEPTAPAALKAIYRAVVNSLELELRG